MRKYYKVPVLRTQRLELGVFGDYGQDDGGDGSTHVVPVPIKIIDGFELHLE
jgi:hypothetical protein